MRNCTACKNNNSHQNPPRNNPPKRDHNPPKNTQPTPTCNNCSSEISCVACGQYQFGAVSGSVILNPENYVCAGCELPSPGILPINSIFTFNGTGGFSNVVSIGNSGSTISFQLNVDKVDGVYIGNLVNIPTGVAVSFPQGNEGSYDIQCGTGTQTVPFATNVLVTLGSSAFFDSASYVDGDTYNLQLLTCCEVGGIGSVGVRSEFIRVSRFSIDTSFGGTADFGCTGCGCIIEAPPCDSVRIPRVRVIAQTLVDGSDVGEAIFIICDKFSYYKSSVKDLDACEGKCAIRYIAPEEVKQTTFNKCCPLMVSVLKGRGHTLCDKALYIYNKLGQDKIGTTFRLFYQNLMLYGMSRYILARLLYGDFNINYLLRKYDDEFFKDLNNSRFCAFIEFFEDCASPVKGYSKYFLRNN